MELTKILTLKDKEVDALASLLGEMPASVIKELVKEGNLSSGEADIIHDIYEKIRP